MYETRHKLCPCDDLHKLQTFLKFKQSTWNAFKSIEYDFQLFLLTVPVCICPSFKYLLLPDHLMSQAPILMYVKKTLRKKNGRHAGTRLTRRQKKDKNTNVLNRWAPKSGITDVIFYLFSDHVWIKMVIL